MRWAVGAVAAATACAQIVTPGDPREKARFDAVTRAMEQAGYRAPGVVGYAADLFAVLASREGRGVVAIAAEGTRPAVAIEEAETPAAIGVRGVRFEPFLDDATLIDIIVDHEPYRLESSHRFERHHILRRTAAGIEPACDFDGASRSGYAKGPRSVATVRTVTVQRAGAGRFDVTSAEETSERTGGGAPTVTDRKEVVTRYRLGESGSCTAIAH